MRTFVGVEVWDGEHCLNTLCAWPAPQTVAAKRTPVCAEHLLRDMRLYPGLHVVDIIRDPRDVVTSELSAKFWCDFARWRRDVRVGQELARTHQRCVRVRYEELVTAPDDVQAGWRAHSGWRWSGRSPPSSMPYRRT